MHFRQMQNLVSPGISLVCQQAFLDAWITLHALHAGSLLELYKEAMQLELDFFEAHNPEHAVADEDSGTAPAAAEAV